MEILGQIIAILQPKCGVSKAGNQKGLTATLPYTFGFYRIARIKNGNCFLVPQIMRIFASRKLTKIK